MTYQELQEALEIFHLSERATLSEIRSRHRQLVRQYHPDHGNVAEPERIILINAAYETLRSYVDNYRFCFAEEEFYEQNADERLRRQFAQDPLWGGR